MVEQAFLRSINIQLDIGHPERFEHFRPTSKSIRLFAPLVQQAQGSALFVVAPYGLGKSITAGFAGQLVENHPESRGMLEAVGTRVETVDDDLSRVLQDRLASQTMGIFVPLYGHLPTAPVALKEAILSAMRRCRLGRQARSVEKLPAETSADLAKLLEVATKKLAASGFDRLVIVWDEFGRHLQGLISEGRPEELDVLQVLAEVVQRTSAVPVSLSLLLHRSLLGYAGGLPSGVRREWAKIEGRFETLQYLDDSNELYDLIGSIVEESRDFEPGDHDFAELSEAAQEAGYFPDLDSERLARALETAYPLDPTTLFLLPRVAARVAQNERTLFSFLEWVSLEEETPPSTIYDYFRGDFRSDGGAGGTQRPWLETESALHKVEEGSDEHEALKTAFLLGLGLGGERAHATFSQLCFALSPGDPEAAAPVIDGLIDRRLLVHRRHSDQVVVWHGTDVDLRGRLEDEKKRSSADFNLAAFLTREAPPPVWRPVEYNARTGVRRYLLSEYTTADGLQGFLQEFELSNGWEPGTDGRILYVLPRSSDEAEDATSIASEIDDPRLFVVVANEVGALRGAALDLWCLLRMHADHELIGRDPLVKSELDHLTDDVRTGLQPLLDRVLLPQEGGSRWFHQGNALALSSVPQLRRTLSETMEMVFPHTPEIGSEMVVRRQPSSVVVNARKKVELGLLERYGQEELGIEGSFADKSIFRCVFLRSGLYRDLGERWGLAAPEDIELPGIRMVWARVRAFFSEPGVDKSPRDLITTLLEPPFGVRAGLIPLLLAAGAKAFPTAMAIRRHGQFVDDLLPSVIEDMSKSPDDYRVDVVGLTENEERYLRGLLELFGHGPDEATSGQGDLLRICMDAVLMWRHRLPAAVSGSRRLSGGARRFEEELRTPDPVRLFLQELPTLVGRDADQPEALLAGVAKLRDELAAVEVQLQKEAAAALHEALDSRGIANGAGVRDQAQRWAAHFPKAFGRALPGHVTKGVLSRLRSPYRDDGALMNALATLLVGRPIRQWDDTVVPAFRRQLRTALEEIEGTALHLAGSQEADPELREGLVALAQARMERTARQLGGVLGSEEAARRLEAMAARLRAVHADGTEAT